MNSSTAVPPEYCPRTSAPGFTLRAITSPSIGARSVNSCETLSALAARNIRAFWRARSTSARALRKLSSAVSKSRCDPACAAYSSCWRCASCWDAMRSACALSRSAKALPTSGDSIVASGAPLRTRWPGSARIRLMRPVTGENTCATRRSSKATLPLVTISLPTGWGATGSIWTLASRTCCSVSQTSSFGGCASCFVAAGRALAPRKRCHDDTGNATPLSSAAASLNR